MLIGKLAKITGGDLKQSKLCFCERLFRVELTRRFTPSYSTHLSLPNNHSSNILTVTKNKKITIFTINPLDQTTNGVTDIMINSKSKIKKIIQKIKKRKETGKTLTLKESKPHSNLSLLINLEETNILPKPINAGTTIEINK